MGYSDFVTSSTTTPGATLTVADLERAMQKMVDDDAARQVRVGEKLRQFYDWLPDCPTCRSDDVAIAFTGCISAEAIMHPKDAEAVKDHFRLLIAAHETGRHQES